MHVEVRVLQAEGRHQADALLQLLHLGELFDAVAGLVDRLAPVAVRDRLRGRGRGRGQDCGRGGRLRRGRGNDGLRSRPPRAQEARVAMAELAFHSARHRQHAAVARLEHDAAAHRLAGGLLQGERRPQGALGQGSQLDVFLDAHREARALQLRPGPVGGELERAVERHRIDGPRGPPRLADPVGRTARLHPADDAARRELLDLDDRAQPRAVEGVALVELCEPERQLDGRGGRGRGHRRAERRGHVDPDGGEPDVAGEARRLRVDRCGQAHGELGPRSCLAPHCHRELGVAGDADRLLELEVAHQDGRSGAARRFQRRRRHRVQRRGEGEHGLAGELMILEVHVVASRYSDPGAVRGAALGPRGREQQRARGACLQRREQGLLSGAVVDERNALLGERGTGKSRDPRHHGGAVPGRVFQRKRAHARPQRRQELRGPRER